MTKSIGKAKVIDAFSVLVVTGKICLQEFQSPENTGKARSREVLSLVKEAQVRGYLK